MHDEPAPYVLIAAGIGIQEIRWNQVPGQGRLLRVERSPRSSRQREVCRPVPAFRLEGRCQPYPRVHVRISDPHSNIHGYPAFARARRNLWNPPPFADWKTAMVERDRG